MIIVLFNGLVKIVEIIKYNIINKYLYNIFYIKRVVFKFLF